MAAQLVDMVLELLLGGHCMHIYQTQSFLHIPTGFVRYISLWNVFLSTFFFVTCLRLGSLTNANRWILCDTEVAIAKRLEYFDCVISPVACYAAGHKSIYRNGLHCFDVLQRRFLRSVVAPPRSIDWTHLFCFALRPPESK